MLLRSFRTIAFLQFAVLTQPSPSFESVELQAVTEAQRVARAPRYLRKAKVLIDRGFKVSRTKPPNGRDSVRL